MLKTNKKAMLYVIALSVIVIFISVTLFAWPKTSSSVNITDGTDGTNGTNGNDGANGFNGAAMDYTIVIATDNSWYAAVPGVPSLPFYNETDATTLLDETILALNGSIVKGGTIRILKGILPLTHTVLLDPEVSLQGSGIFTILRAAANFSAMVSDSGNTAASVRDISIECSFGDNRVAVGINSTGNEFIVENVWVSNFTGVGISIGNATTTFGTEITLHDCHVGPSAPSDAALLAGILVSQTTDALLDHCLINNVNGTGILVNTSNGIIIDRCTIENVNGTGIAIEFSNACDVHSGRINVTTEAGISVTDSVNVDISHYDISFCDGNGTNLAAVTYATVSTLSVSNCSSGIYLNDVDNSTVSESFFLNSTGRGIYMIDCNSNLVIQVHAGNNVGKVSDGGASNHNQFSTSYFFDGLAMVGGNDVVLSCWTGTSWEVYVEGIYDSP